MFIIIIIIILTPVLNYQGMKKYTMQYYYYAAFNAPCVGGKDESQVRTFSSEFQLKL